MWVVTVNNEWNNTNYTHEFNKKQEAMEDFIGEVLDNVGNDAIISNLCWYLESIANHDVKYTYKDITIHVSVRRK